LVRALISLGLHLAANALGLLVAAAVLDNMTLDAGAFLVEIAIFTAVEFVAQPVIVKLALRHADFLMGGTALISTFVALVVTTWLSDGLQISGASTWVLATLIVWLAALLAGLLLPAIFLKKAATNARA
jgi:hypothetical protein